MISSLYLEASSLCPHPYLTLLTSMYKTQKNQAILEEWKLAWVWSTNTSSLKLKQGYILIKLCLRKETWWTFIHKDTSFFFKNNGHLTRFPIWITIVKLWDFRCFISFWWYWIAFHYKKIWFKQFYFRFFKNKKNKFQPFLTLKQN